MPESEYDIIVCGAGLAGLSLLYQAMKSGIWAGQRILVVDESPKNSNDRTWSFWKKGETVFDELIFKQWEQLSFYTAKGQKMSLEPGGYTYNSIRSIDFYQHVVSYLQSFDHIHFVWDNVLKFRAEGQKCILKTKSAEYTSTYLFNSIYQPSAAQKDSQYFLQHFKGWRIQTQAALPPLSEAYLMDFRTGQAEGTTFFYTLPLKNNELFVEYTLFTKSVLKKEEYDRQIELYLKEVLHINEYELLEEESGIIPMTDFRFNRFEGNIIHIGTAGGDTRGSTGYTFINTQKTVQKILESYRAEGHPFFKQENVSLRHHLYDSTLLHVLDHSSYEGHQVFTDLFLKCPAPYIFAFLDAETTLLQDIMIMKSLKVMPFIRAFSIAVYKRIFQ